MSVPRVLGLPAGIEATNVPATGEAPLAALVARPDGEPRGSALFVPGFTGSKEDFLAVLGPLRERGWHCVAVDQRGQYESPWGDDAAYSLERLAEDVLAVREGLEAPVHLVGHSFGGLVARSAVLADPTAFATLTLMSSGPAALPDGQAARARMLLAGLGELDLTTIWGMMRELETASGMPVPAETVLAFLERRWLANDPVQLRRFAEHLLGEPDRVDELREALAKGSGRAMVLHGEADDVWPPALQETMARRLGARHEVVAGAVHSPAAEQAATTAALLAMFWVDER